jgi:hypothetical protein
VEVEVRWFAPGELPLMTDFDRDRIRHALAETPETFFIR